MHENGVRLRRAVAQKSFLISEELGPGWGVIQHTLAALQCGGVRCCRSQVRYTESLSALTNGTRSFVNPIMETQDYLMVSSSDRTVLTPCRGECRHTSHKRSRETRL
jgi:hypothetical protein